MQLIVFRFNRTVDQLIANHDVQQGVAAQMLKDKEKQIEPKKKPRKPKRRRGQPEQLRTAITI